VVICAPKLADFFDFQQIFENLVLSEWCSSAESVELGFRHLDSAAIAQVLTKRYHWVVVLSMVDILSLPALSI